jgi:hypothetical protein
MSGSQSSDLALLLQHMASSITSPTARHGETLVSEQPLASNEFALFAPHE